MAIFFLLVGLVLLDSGVRGNAQQLIAQIETDAKGFVAFGSVVLILGAAGISSTLRPIAKYMLLLVFVVYFLKNSHAIVPGFEQAASGATNTPSPGAQQAQAASAQAAQGAQTGGASGSWTDSGNPNTAPLAIIQSGAHDLADASQTLAQGYDASVQVTPNAAGSGTAKARGDLNYGIQTVGSVLSLFSFF